MATQDPDVHKPGGYIAVGVAAIIWNVLSIITCKVNAKSTRGIMLPNISLSLFKLELKNWSCATSWTTTAALWYLLCMLCWYTKQQCVQPLCTRLQKAADTVTYFSHLWKLEPKCRWPVSFDRICCLLKNNHFDSGDLRWYNTATKTVPFTWGPIHMCFWGDFTLLM